MGMMHGGGGGAEGGMGARGEVFCLMQFCASIDHGSHHHPKATMRPYSWQQSIQHSANILCKRFALLKLEKILLLIFVISLRHDASKSHCSCLLPVMMVVLLMQSKVERIEITSMCIVHQ